MASICLGLNELMCVTVQYLPCMAERILVDAGDLALWKMLNWNKGVYTVAVCDLYPNLLCYRFVLNVPKWSIILALHLMVKHVFYKKQTEHIIFIQHSYLVILDKENVNEMLII